MKNKKNTPHFLDFGGIKIKVYLASNTPIIQPSDISTVPRRIHTHFTYEIFFITEGKLDVSIGEDAFVFENCVLILPPHVKHCSSPASDGCFCLLFSFDEASAATDPIRALPENGFLQFPITEEISFYIRTLAAKSRLDTKAAQRDTEHLTALVFNAVFSALLPENKAVSPSARSQAHISAIEDYINANYRRKLTLSDVAGHVHLSTKQVCRIIEKEYGIGFSDLVAKKRMASAEAMLVSTDLKISQIAAEFFPDTPTYFYTLFKKKHGTSPLNYRRAHVLSQRA